MSDARIIGQRVVLPWAPAYTALSEDRGSSQQDGDDFLRVEVGSLSMAVGELPRYHTMVTADRQLDQRLIGLGLPYAPLPEIPPADRGEVIDEQLLALAVALDVLTTLSRRTGQCAAGVTVLCSWVRTLAHVGHLGGMTKTALEKLADYAAGAAGERREQISSALLLAMSESEIEAESKTKNRPTNQAASIQATTPAAVMHAIAQLERAAQHIIDDAALCLAAQEPVDYRRA